MTPSFVFLLCRSHLGGLALSLTELPSPSLVVQEKLRNSAKGRLARNPHCNGYTLQQQGLLRRGNNSYRHLFKQVGLSARVAATFSHG